MPTTRSVLAITLAAIVAAAVATSAITIFAVVDGYLIQGALRAETLRSLRELSVVLFAVAVGAVLVLGLPTFALLLTIGQVRFHTMLPSGALAGFVFAAVVRSPVAIPPLGEAVIFAAVGSIAATAFYCTWKFVLARSREISTPSNA